MFRGGHLSKFLVLTLVAPILGLAQPVPANSAPPNLPLLSAPYNGQSGVSVNPRLRWTATDPDGDILVYDVYLGTIVDDLALVASNLPQASYAAGPLSGNTRYYWSVVARDPGGAETASLTWTFITVAGPPPPDGTLVVPRDGAVAQLTTLTFDWSAFDPNGEGVSYSFYLGTTNPPPYWATLNTTSRQLTLDPDVQYYWRIIYHDALGEPTYGPVWTFHTDVAHPTQLTATSPADLSVEQSLNLILVWDAFEPDGDPMHFDVHFGTTTTPATVSSFQAGTTFNASEAFSILPSTTYYWRIIARTNNGSTTGPLWSFVTRPNSPPSTAFGQTPPDGGVAHNPPWMNWLATDIDAPEQNLRYNVYFGTTNPPPLVEAARHAPNYSPGLLQEGTTYFWSITVSDPFVSTPGPVWSFMVDDSMLTGTGEAPAVTTLGRNFPNPFNPQTVIPYGVPDSRSPVRVQLVVYDTLGRRVRVLVDELQSGGTRDVIWRGDDDRGARVSSGVYYCVLQVGSDRRTQKMVLLK